MKKFTLYLILSLCISFAYGQNQLDDTLKVKEVIVTGSKVEVARKNVPLTISVISEKELQTSNESALLPVISQKVPGLFVSERSVTGFGVAEGAAGKISVRGVSGTPNTRVLILIDGHPQYQGIFGHPLPDAYVTSDAEKVEVIRGPGSILYGSNAMGGVINIITKKQRKDGFSGNARASYGSYNTQKYMGSLGYKKDKFTIYASVNHDHTDGHRDSSAFTITNGYVKAGYKISDHIKAMADFSLADFVSDNPGPVFNEDDYNTFNVDIIRAKTSLSLENQYDKVSGALKFFHNFGEHKLSDGWHSNDNNSGLMFYQALKLIRGNTFTLGLDYKTFGGEAKNTLSEDDYGTFNENETAFYAIMQQILMNKLVVNGGVRLENSSAFGTEWVPQAGLAYHPANNTTLKLAASKGFRSPTIKDLYLFPPKNPDLQPERMWNYEISLLQHLIDKRLNIELTGFIAKGEDMIQLVPLETPPPFMRFQNTGTFSNKGIEFATRFKASKNLGLTANYSYLHLDEPVLTAPKHQVYAGIDYNYKIFGFNLDFQHINELYTQLPAQDTPAVTESYSLLNARITAQVLDFMNIFVAGKNLLDQKYEINYGYPMPGITFFGGVNVSF